MQSNPIISKDIIRRAVMLALAPLVVILTLVLIFKVGVHAVPVAVYNADKGIDMPMMGHVAIPDTILSSVRKGLIITNVTSRDAGNKLIAEHRVRAYFEFPEDLTREMMIRMDDPSYIMTSKIGITLTKGNPLVNAGIVAQLGQAFLKNMKSSGAPLPIPVDINGVISSIGNPGDYMMTVLLGFLAFVLTGVFTATALIAIRKSDTFAQSGISRASVCTLITIFTAAGTTMLAGLTVGIYLLIGAPLHAPVLIAMAFSIVLIATAAALAAAIGLHAPKTEDAFRIIPLLILPLFFGGFLVPAESMPVWLRFIQYIMPPSYALKAGALIAMQQASPYFISNVCIAVALPLVFGVLAVTGAKQK